MRTRSRAVRLIRYVAMVTLAGILVHPLFALGVALVCFPRRGGRARRPGPSARQWLEGTVEVWDLRGVQIRMGAHELRVVGSHGPAAVSVHDLAGAEVSDWDVYLVRQDGLWVSIGRSRAEAQSLVEAVATLDAAIRKRSRGALDDREEMYASLQASRVPVASR